MADGTLGSVAGPALDDDAACGVQPGDAVQGGAGFTMTDAPPHEGELARLAALDSIAYEQARQAAADTLGVRMSTLDAEVEARRPMPEAATGRGVSLPTAETWPDPVRGGELLDALTAAVRRHVIVRPVAAEAVALWVAHTWVAERFQHTPRLGITSPAKRCGKSTLLDVLRATCHRPRSHPRGRGERGAPARALPHLRTPGPGRHRRPAIHLGGPRRARGAGPQGCQ